MSKTEIQSTQQEDTLVAKEQIFNFFSNYSNGASLNQILNVSLALPFVIPDLEKSSIKEKINN